MKRLILTLVAGLLATAVAQAHPTIDFATELGAPDSWTLTHNGVSWQMSFATNNSTVTGSIPDEAVLLGDYVNLPTMTITGLVDQGGYFTGTFNPDGDLTIVSDPGGAEVFRASVASGEGFVAGTNWFAFQNIADDLQVVSYTPDYSDVLDELAGYDDDPLYLLDLNVAGTSEFDLYQTLQNTEASAVGGLAGTINAVPIPAPGALMLTGLGTAIVGWARRKRHM
jgi:hypothetical protein